MDTPDYGIDGQVEIFDDGQKTGLAFYVQLRATDELVPIKAKKIKVKTDELDYYLSKTEPVMIARYSSATNTMYWQWASRLRQHGRWTKKSVAILDAPENRYALVKALAWQGRFSEAADIFENAGKPVHPDRRGVLIGILCMLFRDEGYSYHFTNSEDTLTVMETICSNEASKPELAAPAWLMLFLQDPTRLYALLNAIRVKGDQGWLQLGELAIEFGIECYGLAFPSAIRDLLRQCDFPEKWADAMVEAFSLKVREMETGEQPSEIRVLQNDGKYVRYVRIGDSLEWEAIHDS